MHSTKQNKKTAMQQSESPKMLSKSYELANIHCTNCPLDSLRFEFLTKKRVVTANIDFYVLPLPTDFFKKM